MKRAAETPQGRPRGLLAVVLLLLVIQFALGIYTNLFVTLSKVGPGFRGSGGFMGPGGSMGMGEMLTRGMDCIIGLSAIRPSLRCLDTCLWLNLTLSPVLTWHEINVGHLLSIRKAHGPQRLSQLGVVEPSAGDAVPAGVLWHKSAESGRDPLPDS